MDIDALTDPPTDPVAGPAGAAARQPLAAHKPSTSKAALTLDGESLTWADLIAIMEADAVSIDLASSARQRMARTRTGAFQALSSGQRVYGWNQALGALKDRPLDQDEQREFQRRVLRSHAAGVGRPSPVGIARLTLVLRANAMARGAMGVRPELVDRLLALVNAGVTPKMPGIGSLGIGDLQPMAAAGLVATGGPASAQFEGREGPAREILSAAGLDPDFDLEAGEALAIVSGSSVVSAGYVAGVTRIEMLIDVFRGAFALFLEATRAEAGAFDARIHNERGIPAETAAAEGIRVLVEGSGWMTDEGRRHLGEVHPRIQDSVAVRSAPHKIAAIYQVLVESRTDLVREANASSSNPLILLDPERGLYEFVMGGNWDAGLLGHTVDTLNSQIAALGMLSHELSGRLLAPAWSYGLPSNLAGGNPGLNSGMVQVQTVATALIPEMQLDAAPAGILSRSTKFGQEDHNTMAALSVQRLHYNLDRLEIVLAVLLLLAAQGIDLILPRMNGFPLGDRTAQLHRAIRASIPPLDDDRYMTPDVGLAIEIVKKGMISDIVLLADSP